MQRLDRVNARLRRRAAAMHTATLRQGLENNEQQSRMRGLREEPRALRRRACLDGVQDVSSMNDKS